MDKKVVFITGGNSGIGAALAREFLSHGHCVYVCARSQETFEKEFALDSLRPNFFQLDVSDREQCKAVMGQIVEKEQKIDIVVANAGIAFAHKSKIPDFDRSKKMIEINVLGLMYTFEAALDYMLKVKSGQIVGVSSVAGFNGLPGVAAYSGSKAAVLKMCESYALDLPQYGVDVTCICPGFIDTPLTQKNKHPMPFLMSADSAAKRIYKAIEKRKVFYSLPNRMYLVVRFLEIIPRWLYRRLMKIKSINYGKA